jgi:hypothetical protein
MYDHLIARRTARDWYDSTKQTWRLPRTPLEVGPRLLPSSRFGRVAGKSTRPAGGATRHPGPRQVLTSYVGTDLSGRIPSQSVGCDGISLKCRTINQGVGLWSGNEAACAAINSDFYYPTIPASAEHISVQQAMQIEELLKKAKAPGLTHRAAPPKPPSKLTTSRPWFRSSARCRRGCADPPDTHPLPDPRPPWKCLESP